MKLLEFNVFTAFIVASMLSLFIFMIHSNYTFNEWIIKNTILWVSYGFVNLPIYAVKKLKHKQWD